MISIFEDLVAVTEQVQLSEFRPVISMQYEKENTRCNH